MNKGKKSNSKRKNKGVLKGISKNYWAISTVILAILLIAILSTSGTAKIGPDKAGELVLNFANENGASAELIEVTEEAQFYSVLLKIQGQEVPVRITKDGSNLVPSLIPLNSDGNDEVSPTPTQQQAPEVVKSDKPDVELYVMSICPYGTQMEKGILPVIDLLGDKIDFEIKFVSYAMHDIKEINENTVQYCVQKHAPEKLNEYLYCYLEENSAEVWDACIDAKGIDRSTIEACIDNTNEEFGILDLYEDRSTWSGGRYPQYPIHAEDNTRYGVRGSPTLVINGAQVSSSRDSASILSTICAAFNTAPKECSTAVSSAPPSPGFGFTEGTAGATAAAQCA